jgi:hypothetical protein
MRINQREDTDDHVGPEGGFGTSKGPRLPVTFISASPLFIRHLYLSQAVLGWQSGGVSLPELR